MKNLRELLNTKKGKVIAWLCVLLVAVLAALLAVGIKFIQRRGNELDNNQTETGTKLEDTSTGEKPIEYKKLSNDSYQIDEEAKTITFSANLDVKSFVLSDNPNGPATSDVWHSVSGDEAVEILDSETHKKYVYYMAANCSILVNMKLDGNVWNDYYGVVYLSTSPSNNSGSVSRPINISGGSGYYMGSLTNGTYYIWAQAFPGGPFVYTGRSFPINPSNSTRTIALYYYTVTASQGAGTSLRVTACGYSLTSGSVLGENVVSLGITASLNQGYRDLSLTCNGSPIASGTSFTFDGSQTIVSSATINTSSLTVNPNGGSVNVTSPTGGAQETITTSKTYTQDYNTTLTYVNPTKEDTTSYSSNYVSYNTDGGSIAPTTQNSTRTIVTGYTFSGWTKGDEFVGTLNEENRTYTFPADNGVTSTITAYYTPYTISETVAPVTLAAAPTKAGYTFAGWKSSINNQVYNAGASYTPLENTTMTAQWKVNKVTITLKKDGNNSTELNGYKVYISTSSTSNTKTWSGTTGTTSTLDISGTMSTSTTYYIWTGKDSNHKTADGDMVYTGISFTGASAATATLNFYTITVSLSNITMTFNGTSLSDGEKVVALGTASAIHSIEAILLTGYKFLSWESNNAKTTITSTTAVNTTLKAGAEATVTLHARWTRYIATDGITTSYFLTLLDSYNYIVNTKNSASGTITATDDIPDNSVVTIDAGKEITIDTNGYTITLTSSSGSMAINNKGKLTIKGNGKIKTSNNSISNDNTGVLNIIENTQILSPNIEYGISNVGNGKVTLKRGKIY